MDASRAHSKNRVSGVPWHGERSRSLGHLWNGVSHACENPPGYFSGRETPHPSRTGVYYRILCVARVTQGSRLSLLVERALRCWSSCGCGSCGRARCGLGLERVPEPGLLEREDAGTPVRIVGQFCIAFVGGRSENMLAGLGRTGSSRRVERTVELSRNKAVEPLDVLVVQEAAVA